MKRYCQIFLGVMLLGAGMVISTSLVEASAFANPYYYSTQHCSDTGCRKRGGSHPPSCADNTVCEVIKAGYNCNCLKNPWEEDKCLCIASESN